MMIIKEVSDMYLCEVCKKKFVEPYYTKRCDVITNCCPFCSSEDIITADEPDVLKEEEQ
jgi:hydrogenase maturation factor HypF (carbamoyltransferase family)